MSMPFCVKFYFNPLASERRDMTYFKQFHAAQISIHSPLRGETGIRAGCNEFLKISIHSPLRGETVAHPTKRTDVIDFNPLASERRDRSSSTGSIHMPISIHSPLRGETRPGLANTLADNFNPLASERRDSKRS